MAALDNIRAGAGERGGVGSLMPLELGCEKLSTDGEDRATLDSLLFFGGLFREGS